MDEERESTRQDPDSFVPKFLPDDPALEDKLGCHTHTVEALRAVIEAGNVPGPIGIVGPFGCGKSTVIRQAKKLLQGEQLRFWQFDAWAHKADQLRRLFLRQLADGLKDWLPCGYASSLVTRLRASTEARPLVGIWSFAIILVLLAAAILAPRVSSELVEPSKALLLFIPVLIAAVGVYAGTRSVQKGAARSPEFGREFRALLETALGGNKHRGVRLVMVLDNIDRLVAADLLDAFSVMRTFMDELRPEEPCEGDWRGRVILIVPFDEKRIGNELVKGQYIDSTFNQELADTFMQKLCPLVLRMSMPPLLNWQEYFDKSFAQVFQKHLDAEREEIRALFAQPRGPEDLPSPREVKHFINELAAIYLARRECVRPLCQALYLVLRHNSLPDKNGQKGDTTRLDEFLIDPDEPRVLAGIPGGLLGDEEWKEEVAAVHFGVDQKRAAHMLLVRRIGSALTSGVRSRLERWGNTEGFEEVLGTQLLAVTAEAEAQKRARPDKIGRPAFALGDRETPWIWKQLAKSLANVLAKDSIPRSEEGSLEGQMSSALGEGLALVLVRHDGAIDETNALRLMRMLPPPGKLLPGTGVTDVDKNAHAAKHLAGYVWVASGLQDAGFAKCAEKMGKVLSGLSREVIRKGLPTAEDRRRAIRLESNVRHHFDDGIEPR